MVFPFGLPKPEADPSDFLFHAQCFHWWPWWMGSDKHRTEGPQSKACLARLTARR